MTDELKHPWESAAVREQLGIKSVWFANAADGIRADDFQPEVPAEHPLRQVTLCHIVLNEGQMSVVTGMWPSAGDDAQRLAWADAVSQI